MKVDWADKIDPTVLAQPDGTLRAINLVLRSLTPGLRNGLSIADNMNARIVTLGAVTVGGITQPTLTSGVEYLIKNPLAVKKPGFTPLYATDSAGNAVAIASCKVNQSRSDGRLGITVTQDLLGGTGDIGETVSSTLAFGSATALTTGVIKSVTTITLGAGSWLISSLTGFTGTPTGVYCLAAINTSVADPGAAGEGSNRIAIPLVPNTNAPIPLAIPNYPVQITSTTTYNNLAQSSFSAGSVSAYGRITAVRTAKVQNTMLVTGVLWGG